MKKTLSILLALVMVLTSCFVASAETTETATDLIGAYGSYDVKTYGWSFSTLKTPVQSGDTVQDDNSYTAEELANTILYNKTGAGYGQWLPIDANTLEFDYNSSNFVSNEQRYGQSTYGIAFDENLRIARAVRGFEVGKYYKVSFDLAHRFDIDATVRNDFYAGVVSESDLTKDITLNGGNFTETNFLIRQSFVFYADDSIVDADGYAYLMFRSGVTDAYVNNFSIVEWEAPVKATDWVVNGATSKNIGTNEGAVAYEGNGIIYDTKSFPERGETLKLDSDALRVSLPLDVKANTPYKLSFSYYSDTVKTVTEGESASLAGNTYAIMNTGIFIPNHPDFEGISGDRLNFALTMTYLNYYASNFQMNTPAGRNWNVNADGSNAGYVDQNGDGTVEDARKYAVIDNYHGVEANKWYTLSFVFNTRDFEDIAFTLRKIAGNMWLDDIVLEDLSNIADGAEADADSWLVNGAASTNIGTNEGAVAYTDGQGVALDNTTFPERGNTLKLDKNALRVSLPLNVEPNTDYILTFSYYTDAVSKTSVGGASDIPYAINNTGIFIPNHPDFEGISGNRVGFAYTMTYLNYYGSNLQMKTPLGRNWNVNADGSNAGYVDGDKRTYNQVEGYHNIEAGKWYTLSFEFNSANFEDIAFTLRKPGSNMWLDDVQLTVNQSAYFENPNNWVLSLIGSQENRKNISVDGTDGTYFSGEKGSSYHAVDNTTSVDAGGSSLKLLWASHASNIAMPTLKSGKTYRLKFSYKVVTSEGLDLTKKQMNYIGLYSPSAVDKAIVEGNTEVKFSDRSVGWNSVDYFLSDGKYRYRDTTLTYCAQTANRYDAIAGDYSYAAANEWYDEEIYFTATDYTDLHLIIVPGDDNKGGMFVDNFEFEEVDLNSTFTVDGENTPVSMRKATDGGVKQAIRYKFSVDNDLKANGLSGYEIKEYGAVAASDKWLSEGELPEYDLATGEGKTTELNKKSAVGVAYNKENSIDNIFELTDDVTIFSAALYNIGLKGKTTDYYEWSTDYVVRPYAVYYNEAANHTVLVYGDTASASVFAVMNEILSSDNAEDKEYVENLLANEDILNEYLSAGYSYGESETLTIQKKNNG